MFNVIQKLEIFEKADKLLLRGEWLNRGEIMNFTLQCLPGDVFKTLERMKVEYDKNPSDT